MTRDPDAVSSSSRTNSRSIRARAFTRRGSRGDPLVEHTLRLGHATGFEQRRPERRQKRAAAALGFGQGECALEQRARRGRVSAGLRGLRGGLEALDRASGEQALALAAAL